MNPLEFVRLMLRYKWLLLLSPVLAAVLVFFVLRGKPKEYESHTVIYTGLVSGYNIESGSEARIDYMAVNSGFDNLINTIRSRSTLTEAGAKMIELIICNPGRYPESDLSEWTEPIHRSYRAFQLSGDCTDALEWAMASSEQDSSAVYDLLFRSSSPLDLAEIGDKLQVKRIGNSDLLELRYRSQDPLLTQELLNVLTDVFIDRYESMKRREAGSILSFFEKETSASNRKLQVAVGRLRDFGTANRVINYYEQTKAIAGQKEGIDQQIRSEQMKLEAANSAVRDLESRIGATTELSRRGEQLVQLRSEYAELTAKAALKNSSDIRLEPSSGDLSRINREIETAIAGLYAARYSKEGISKEDVVARWLEAMVEIAEHTATLEVLQKRREEYAEIYDEFAPMGSMLSSLEREVDIAENEYLALLHSLNQARMRQENIELSSQMDVIDRPAFPERPQPSKIFLLMIMATIASFTVVLGIAVSRELLDTSLRSADRAKEQTGLNVLGGYPTLRNGSEKGHGWSAAELAIARTVTQLDTMLFAEPPANPKVVLICSSVAQTGKSTLLARLAAEMEQRGQRVLALTPSASSSDRLISYEPGPGFTVSGLITELTGKVIHDYDIVLVETLAFSLAGIPITLVQSASQVVWVARADRLWSRVDRSAAELFVEVTKTPPCLWLNHMRKDHLEEIVGELPRPRSKLRSQVKQILQRNFA